MINVAITPNIDFAPWTDLQGKEHTCVILERLGRLPRGMQNGASTVFFHATDGKTGEPILVQTSMAIFQAAAQVFRICDAKETPRQPHPADSKHSETVGNNPALRYRLTPLVTALGATTYVKMIETPDRDPDKTRLAGLHPDFTSDDLRAIADDMDARAARA